MPELKNSAAINILGYIAVVLFGTVMATQLLLALGILPVSMAWGGQHNNLTPGLRISSLVAFFILGGFAYVIGRKSGILEPLPPSPLIRIMSWLITLYLGFNTVMNFLSSSPAERWIFGPLTLALVVLCLVISVLDYAPAGGGD